MRQKVWVWRWAAAFLIGARTHPPRAFHDRHAHVMPSATVISPPPPPTLRKFTNCIDGDTSHTSQPEFIVKEALWEFEHRRNDPFSALYL